MMQRSSLNSAGWKRRKTELFSRHPAIEFAAVNGHGLITRGDALTFCKALRSEIADIVFLDPPFNLGKNMELPGGLRMVTLMPMNSI
jgi:16S rRNA G966 N2-methylase RsmD